MCCGWGFSWCVLGYVRGDGDPADALFRGWTLDRKALYHSPEQAHRDGNASTGGVNDRLWTGLGVTRQHQDC